MGGFGGLVFVEQVCCINVFMLICGYYDGLGDFVYCVGLFGKSGVGGGILVIVLGKVLIVVWLFGLNV